MDNFNLLFPYYGLDRPESTFYDSVPAVHNPVYSFWVGYMDQKVVWNGVKLPTASHN